jgi:hypothetical protein
MYCQTPFEVHPPIVFYPTIPHKTLRISNQIVKITVNDFKKNLLYPAVLPKTTQPPIPYLKASPPFEDMFNLV